MRVPPLALAATAALGAAVLPWGRLRACCTAFPAGPDTTVRIADQEIIVAWNPDTRVEHFVRQASFQAPAPGFGFLVPTPTRPEVARADNAVFQRLREEIEPRVVHRKRWVPAPTACCLAPFWLALAAPKGMRGGALGVAGGVEVLDQGHVAGYDFSVLAASDAEALAGWLGTHGYDARPALREWIAPYVAERWIVTAFRFAGQERGRVGTDAIRMSFETDRPLFPYRVPKDLLAPEGKGSSLRVFYVGPGRGAGALGQARAPWSAGEVKYASAFPTTAPMAALLEGALPAGDLAPGAWLTAFEDATWPSGTEDLWFSSDPQGEELIPTITVYRDEEVPIPLDLLAAAGIGAFLVRRRLRRAKEPAPPA